MEEQNPPEPSVGQESETEGNANSSSDQVLDAIKNLRFGTVLVTVQDGVIVQIDRTEKRRLQTTRKRNGRGGS